MRRARRLSNAHWSRPPEAVARRVTSHTEVAGLRGPTISKVYPKLGGEEGWYAATVVVRSDLLLQAIDALRRAGASDVSVAPLRYMFQSKCWSFEALRRAGASDVSVLQLRYMFESKCGSFVGLRRQLSDRQGDD